MSDLRGMVAGTQVTTRGQDMRLRVAVIDRDSGFLQVLRNRADAAGWEHRVFSSAVSPDRLADMRLHALVLDLALLGSESWQYVERISARLPGLALIICTGPSSVAQRVRALRLGADAWVAKPCHPEELLAVVQAVVRRHRRAEVPSLDQTIEVGELTIRADRHQAYVRGTSLELTAREFEILHLLSQAERVLRREEIYERLWGYAMAHGDRSVDVFVGKLRHKLRAGSPSWTYIHTHFGVGYRFAAEGQAGLESRGAPVPEPDDTSISAAETAAGAETAPLEPAWA